MRRGELLSLEWEFVRTETRTCFLPITKNGSSREVPLSPTAHQILRDIPRSLDGGVFHLLQLLFEVFGPEQSEEQVSMTYAFMISDMKLPAGSLRKV